MVGGDLVTMLLYIDFFIYKADEGLPCILLFRICIGQYMKLNSLNFGIVYMEIVKMLVF